jgi:hypothetical protein
VGVLEAEAESSQSIKEGAFGFAVELNGNWLASSAPVEDVGSIEDAGAVYVLEHVGPTWIERTRIVSSTPRLGDQFGVGLAYDLDTLAIGAPFADQSALADGNVSVFVQSGASFTPEAVLGQPMGQNGIAFGWSVALDGNNLAVGAPYYDNGAGPASGGVFVFKRAGGVWTPDATLVPTDPESQDWFGYAVAVDGTTALVGAYGKGSDQGAAYVFLRNAAGWSQQAKLVSVPSLAQRQFGFAVALQGNQAFVGAPGSALQNRIPGSVHVFLRTGTVWSKQLELSASNGQAYDFFGGAIEIQGARLVINARDNDFAYLFSGIGPNWVEQLALSTQELGAEAFEGIAVEGTSWILGSPYDDLTGKADAGITRSVVLTSAVAPAQNLCTAGISASGCQALLSACGVPSASAAGGFAVIASTIEGSKDGQFYYGTSGLQLNNPWGNGTSFQCILPPVIRTGIQLAGGTNGLCDGHVIQDFNAYWCPVCPAPQKNPGVGQDVYMQFWYRDPGSTSNQSTSLSDALQFQIMP